MLGYFDPQVEQSTLEKQRGMALKWSMLTVFVLMVVLIIQSFITQDQITISDYFLPVGQAFAISILFILKRYGVNTASDIFSMGAVLIMTIVINIFDDETIFTKYNEEFYIAIFVLVFISFFASRKFLILAALIFFVSSLRVYFHLVDKFPDQVDTLKEIQIFFSFTLINISLILYYVTRFSDNALKTAQQDAKIKQEQNEALLRAQDQLKDYQNNLEDLVYKKTEDLKQAQSRLIQAEKMASLGIMTAGVAHEINNPLNFIKGSYLALKKHFGEHTDGNVKEYFDALEIGVARASSIVSGLNQFSRNKETHDDSCDMHAIIDNCLLILNRQYEGRITINRNYKNGDLTLSGNLGKLHQVFLNILTNSIHAIEETGEISIVTKKVKDQAIVEITDTGIGISKEHLSKITDPFFTTKAPGKGTGLGLSITYSIIMDHGGEIEFVSEKTKGTIVIIKMPIQSAKSS